MRGSDARSRSESRIYVQLSLTVATGCRIPAAWYDQAHADALLRGGPNLQGDLQQHGASLDSAVTSTESVFLDRIVFSTLGQDVL